MQPDAAATGGRNERSARYREVLAPDGIAHELRAVFRDGSGPWAALVLMRGTGVSDFGAHDLGLLAAVSDSVTRALRRLLLLAEIDAHAHPDTPSLLLLQGEATLSIAHAECVFAPMARADRRRNQCRDPVRPVLARHAGKD